MANGTTTSPQSGGIMDAIGSGVEGLAGIAGKVLPYALPIGLGAVMGRGLPGGALGGGAMGLALAEGSAGERQREEQEMRMKQQELGLRAQETDLEIQKAQISLQNEKDTQAYAKTIKDPTARAMYLDPNSRPGYFATVRWNGVADTIGAHPDWLKAHPELDPETLKALGPEAGEKVLAAAMSNKYQHVLPPTKQKDGTWAATAIRPDGGIDLIPTGEPSSLLVKETPPPIKPTDIKTAAAAFLSKNPPPVAVMRGAASVSGGAVGESLEDWRARGVNSMVALGIDEDKAKKYMAEQGGKKADAPAAPKIVDKVPLDARPDPEHPGYLYSKSKNKYYKAT